MTIAPEEQYDRISVFHAHLDVCSQCRNHPFDLCVTGAGLLREAATMEEKKMARPLHEQQQVEYHRQQVIARAVTAADRIILDGSDGSNEETNYLTAKVAGKFVERALHPFNRDILTKDIDA